MVLYFAPLLIVYLIGAFLNVNAPLLLPILASMSLVLLGLGIYQFQIKITRYEWFFGIGLALFFFIPGAYLEFPSDAWEHYRRILSWSVTGQIHSNPIWLKFAYFWDASFIGLGINAISTFWQLALSIQFYRLALKLHPSRKLAALQVLGVWALFGHNVHSFRYYALSSTPLAYASFLELIILFWPLVLGEKILWSRKFGIAVCTCLALIAFNHIQELLLFSIFLFTALVVGSKLSLEKIALRTLGALIVSILIATFVLAHTHLAEWISAGRLYDAFKLGFVSKYGTFRIWNIPGHYFQTLGIHGVVSLVLAVLYAKKERVLALFTLSPTVLLLFPPFVLGFTALTEVPNTYRALYAFPTSFMLVWVVYDFLNRKKQISRYSVMVSALIIALIGLQSSSPWRGRLRFQIASVSPIHSLEILNPLKEWFRDHTYSIYKGCHVISDNMTAFYLSSHFGLEPILPRNYPGSILNAPQGAMSTSQYVNYIIGLHHSCLVILPDSTKSLLKAHSWITQESGHWTTESQSFLNQLPMNPELFEKSILLTGKWSSYLAPPFYKIFMREDCPWTENQCFKMQH